MQHLTTSQQLDAPALVVTEPLVEALPPDLAGANGIGAPLRW